VSAPASDPLPYRISALVFMQNARGEHLLIHRRKAPNQGLWSPIGGKLEMSSGESPHQCAARETEEETGLAASTSDLHLFAMIAEQGYEGAGHWLMFLYDCRRPIEALPPGIDEGRFGFFSRAAIDALPLPETDRVALWPIYDRHRQGFVALRADCRPGAPLSVQLEEILGSPPL
jgi:8-oxo-dGTP diphosphatase